ncbi:MAG: V-type ATP synthase subunit F [Thermoplasmata archaeon]|uniref:A-type ATP synthase subunit F n=1 Tax=Candidatus Sysuiplasma superficiale TaxID=2823368 RepID=A0A8J7YS13_9ARCH|nr:V-type ATP synthase subunit F [Candidatus Sysuiplasma superficiale]
MPASSFAGSAAVIGEREIVLGFRLLGIADAYQAEGREAVEKFRELLSSGKHSFIMLSENIRKFMDAKTVELVNTTTTPLIVFIPLPGGMEEESVEKFAKRVLGVDIGR